MDLKHNRALVPLTLGLTALGLGVAHQASASVAIPITVTGFNRDVIAESTDPSTTQGVTPGDTTETWITTGVDGSSAGIPAGSTATSASTNTVTGTNTTFAFQSATGNNALEANYDNTHGSTTGTLTFAAPADYSSLAFAVAGLDSGSTATSNGFVTYADATTQAFTFNASDWDMGATGIFNPGIGRGEIVAYQGQSTLVHDNQQGRVNIYETDIVTDPTKLVASVTFSGTYSANPYVARNAGVNVFAVSGVEAPASPAPEPSQLGMLALMGLGLGGLMLRARKRGANAPALS